MANENIYPQDPQMQKRVDNLPPDVNNQRLDNMRESRLNFVAAMNSIKNYEGAHDDCTGNLFAKK